jgi:SAM-dependent methyltransferase
MLKPLTEAAVALCPPPARAMLARYLAGEVSAEIALMHLLLAFGTLPALKNCLHEFAKTEHTALLRLVRLAAAHQESLARAARLVEAGLTEARGGDALAATRNQYDRAVAAAPEAAVALYSLGDPVILERATAELAALLGEWGVLGADRDALDIGCGIGRLERALAKQLRHILGIDLSPAMIAEARRRCAAIANVSFSVCNGRDLSQCADRRFDLILAVDCFPCMVAVGNEIALRHIAGAAGLLRPGGSLAIFNYSYRGDIEADRAEIAASATAAGLDVLRNGTRDLELWDGTSFLLRAPLRRE